MVSVLSVVALSLVTSAASAHKRSHGTAAGSSSAESVATAAGIAAADSVGTGAGAGAVGRTGAAGGARARQPQYPMPPMREALLEHPHNKLVHFPLALAVAAALLLVLGRRRRELELAGRWLVWLAALGGAAAYFTGRLQEDAFDGEPKEWLVGTHGRWGTATAIVLAVWALLTLWKPARKHAWLWGLLALALVLVTGFYGGIVAHGE